MLPTGRASGWRSVIAPLSILALTIALAVSFLGRATSSPIPGGWDGVPQYAIASLYARSLFPAISGWVPEYFAGMPFPDFYPPVFYLLIGGLVRVGVSPASAFYGVVAGSVLVLPLLVLLVARRIAQSELAGIAAGAVAIAFVLGGHSAAGLGGTLFASFNLGLSTHALGLDALLGAVYFLIKVSQSRRARVGAGLCLALVPLCNVHVAWDAALLVAAVLGVRLALAPAGGRGRVVREQLSSLLIAALVPMCWLLPMLAHLAFVPTKALEPVPAAAVMRAFLPHFVYLAAAAWLAWRRREQMVLALVLTIVLVLVFALVPLHLVFSGFSIQPWRVLAAFEPLAAVAIGTLIARLSDLVPSLPVRALAVVIVAVAFMSRASPWATPDGLIDPQTAASYAQVVDALRRAPPGRVLVEMGSGRSDGFALQGLVGLAGREALTTVFREASVSSLFAVPLRNAFSAHPELFGIDSKIEPSALLVGERVDDAMLARLATFGVSSVIAGSAALQAKLDGDPRFIALSPRGEWRLYGSTLPPLPLAEIPARGPLLTFARFSVKARPDDAHDFIRLGEEAFSRAWLDAPMVHAEASLEDAELEPFPLVIIVEPEAREPARALARVRRYLDAGGAVVMLDGPTPLHAALRALADRPRVRIVPRLTALDAAESVDDKRGRAAADIAQIFTAVDALLPRGPQRATPVAAGWEAGAVHLHLAATPAVPTPVLLRMSYFPDWRDERGTKVLLASPSFQLLYVDRVEVTIRRRGGPIRAFAWCGTALGLALAASLLFLRSRKTS